MGVRSILLFVVCLIVPDAVAQTCVPAWSVPGGGPDDRINDLAVSSVGGRPALYAVGRFRSAGGHPAYGIARWDGANWSEVGGDITGNGAFALAQANFGGVSVLVMGGGFSAVDGVAASNIAAWDGAQWFPLGAGLNSQVEDLEVFDDGSGPAVYAVGYFTIAGGKPARNAARWNGVSWSATPVDPAAHIRRLVVHDDGTGPALYSAEALADESACVLARWTGDAWAPVSPLVPFCSDKLDTGPRAMASYDDGSGPAIYVSGDFKDSIVQRWSGASWSSFGGGIAPDIWCDKFGCWVNNYVTAMGKYDDGSTVSLVLGGLFGIEQTFGLVKWDGGWVPFEGNYPIFASALTAFDDGEDSRALFVAGSFNNKLIARYGCPALFPGLAAFEPTDYIAAPSGLDLAGHRGWRNDGPADSPPQVYTYASNALDFPLNPVGDSAFLGTPADGPGTASIARHQIDLSSADHWSIDFDFLARSGGADPVYPDLARFVLHIAADPGFRILMDWDDPAAPDSWSIRVDAYDAAGSRRTFDPGPAFHALHAAAWFRTHVKLDLASNAISELTVTDLASGESARIHPVGWHLVGGDSPKMPRRTNIRLATAAAGNGSPGNFTGWDNIRIEPGLPACPADCDFSGDLSLFDFLCFQNDFVAGVPAADCDGDLAFTIFDFLCFTNEFNNGC